MYQKSEITCLDSATHLAGHVAGHVSAITGLQSSVMHIQGSRSGGNVLSFIESIIFQITNTSTSILFLCCGLKHFLVSDFRRKTHFFALCHSLLSYRYFLSLVLNKLFDRSFVLCILLCSIAVLTPDLGGLQTA